MPARTHGDSYSCEYRSWKMMLSRCRNTNDPAFPNYGGRGISVCERWHDYANFLSDIGRRPTPKHTLERIDNAMDYCPDNCRWATRKEQIANRRNSAYVIVDGKRMYLRDAANYLNVPYPTLFHRYHKGQPMPSAK